MRMQMDTVEKNYECKSEDDREARSKYCEEILKDYRGRHRQHMIRTKENVNSS